MRADETLVTACGKAMANPVWTEVVLSSAAARLHETFPAVALTLDTTTRGEQEDRHFKAPIHARGEVSNGLVRMV